MARFRQYTHHGYPILQRPTFWTKSQTMGEGMGGGGGCWAAHFWDNRKRHWLPSSAQKMSCLFLWLPTYLLNIMVSTTQTQSQVKSQECIGHTQKHFITTSPLTYVTNVIHDFVKLLYQRFGAPRPSTRWHAIWWTTSCNAALTRIKLPRAILVLWKGKERNVLFNDALNTFYLRLYGVGHMVKYHSDIER